MHYDCLVKSKNGLPFLKLNESGDSADFILNPEKKLLCEELAREISTTLILVETFSNNNYYIVTNSEYNWVMKCTYCMYPNLTHKIYTHYSSAISAWRLLEHPSALSAGAWWKLADFGRFIFYNLRTHDTPIDIVLSIGDGVSEERAIEQLREDNHFYFEKDGVRTYPIYKSYRLKNCAQEGIKCLIREHKNLRKYLPTFMRDDVVHSFESA